MGTPRGRARARALRVEEAARGRRTPEASTGFPAVRARPRAARGPGRASFAAAQAGEERQSGRARCTGSRLRGAGARRAARQGAPRGHARAVPCGIDAAQAVRLPATRRGALPRRGAARVGRRHGARQDDAGRRSVPRAVHEPAGAAWTARGAGRAEAAVAARVGSDDARAGRAGGGAARRACSAVQQARQGLPHHRLRAAAPRLRARAPDGTRHRGARRGAAHQELGDKERGVREGAVAGVAARLDGHADGEPPRRARQPARWR